MSNPARPSATATPGLQAAWQPVGARLRRWHSAFNERSLRERALMVGAAGLLALAAADQLWLQQAYNDYQQARQEHQQAHQQQLQLREQLTQLAQQTSARLRQDRVELQTWRQRVRDGDSELRKYEATLVGADRMVDLLGTVLAGHGQVKVKQMRSLGRVDLLAPAGDGATLTAPATPPAGTRAATPAAAASAAVAAAASTTPPGPAAAPQSLYRHGVELVLEGSYMELLGYVRELEELPQNLLWGSARLQALQYPTTQLTLRLYTLSRDPIWLAL